MIKLKVAVLLLFVAALLLSACGRHTPPAAHADECVILLHGLARTDLSMHRMQRMLQRNGYHVANVDYPSREYPIEILAPIAVETGLAQCEQKPGISTVHFVTHSLGGILVRAYFENHSIAQLGRVVMLAPPNQGSVAVDEMVRIPGFDWLNGPAGYQLGKGPESVPLKLGRPDFDFAVIAGNRSIDPFTSAVLPDPDDGRVSVADTRLDGMRDFIVVPVSHALIMHDRYVFKLVRNYLDHGSFDPR